MIVRYTYILAALDKAGILWGVSRVKQRWGEGAFERVLSFSTFIDPLDAVAGSES